jgi:hypothetical protein
MLQCYKSAWCYCLGSWIMGNFPSDCMHQEYLLIRRWSLQWKGSCYWEHSCGLMAELCHIWPIMGREYDTQCVCQRQLNLIFKNIFGIITEWSPTFSPNIQIIYVPLGNTHQHLAVVFTSLEQFVRRQTVKWSATSLGRHSNNLTCGYTYTNSDVRSNVESEFQLNDQYPILRVHTYLGCINS